MNTPAFLLGAAILFWGWLGGNLPLAIALAAAFEGARFIDWRVNLAEPLQMRVTDGNTLFALALGVVFYATNGFPRAAVLFFEWLPVILLPVALLQCWGTAGELDLRVLFWSMRRRPPREPRAVNLGYPYLILWVIAASATSARGPAFDVGLAAILAWALWPLRARGRNLAAWCALLGIAVALGYGGGVGLRELQLWLEGAAPEWLAGGGVKVNPYRGTTDIGRLGELKLSDAIVLRVRPGFTLEPPLLLHQASYNEYVDVNWVARGGTFTKLAPGPSARSWRLAGGASSRTLVVDEQARHGNPVLALPAGTVEILDIDAAALRRNPLGAVQGEAPPGFVAYRVGFDPGGGDREAPTGAELQVPAGERAAIERIVKEWGLAGLAPRAAMDLIRRRLRETYAYSTFQNAPAGSATPLADFLLRTRSGHCEHFASATTLLLRASGVPARYATGFAIQEWSALEGAWIARERHSHAWSRAFIDGRWTDVDATPPSWIEMEANERPAWSVLGDAWSWTRYRIARWFGAASQAEKALAFGLPLAMLVLVFAWRWTGTLRAAAVRTRARRAASQGAEEPESDFSRVVRHLEARGFPRSPVESVLEWIARIAPRAPGDVRELARLAGLHYRLRFDPVGLTPAERADLAGGCARWTASVA